MKFTESRVELEIIEKIVDRFINYCASIDMPCSNKLQIIMDVSAANASCPLKLIELLEADNSNFTHDIWGIQRCINRRTGLLEDCFLPRYAYQ